MADLSDQIQGMIQDPRFRAQSDNSAFQKQALSALDSRIGNLTDPQWEAYRQHFGFGPLQGGGGAPPAPHPPVFIPPVQPGQRAIVNLAGQTRMAPEPGYGTRMSGAENLIMGPLDILSGHPWQGLAETAVPLVTTALPAAGFRATGTQLLPEAGPRLWNAIKGFGSELYNVELTKPFTAARPFIGAARGLTAPIEPLPTPRPPAAIPPVRYGTRFSPIPEEPQPIAPIPPVQFGTRFSPVPEETPPVAPIPPVQYGTRFSPVEPLPQGPAAIPPVRFGTRFSPEPLPGPAPVPPVKFGTRFSPPPAPVQRPTIPPVKFGTRFSGVPTAEPPIVIEGIGPVRPTGPEPLPTAPEPSTPEAKWLRSNRDLHATLQQIDLGPESPAGTRASKNAVTDVAKAMGRSTARDLTSEELDRVHEFVLKNRRLPTEAEAKILKVGR